VSVDRRRHSRRTFRRTLTTWVNVLSSCWVVSDADKCISVRYAAAALAPDPEKSAPLSHIIPYNGVLNVFLYSLSCAGGVPAYPLQKHAGGCCRTDGWVTLVVTFKSILILTTTPQALNSPRHMRISVTSKSINRSFLSGDSMVALVVRAKRNNLRQLKVCITLRTSNHG